MAASSHEFQLLNATAAQARDQVAELESERALALITDLASDDAYMRDLEDQLAVWRHHYVAAAVTEIATLLADLSRANSG